MNTRTVRPGELERDLVVRLSGVNAALDAQRRNKALRRATKGRPRRASARLTTPAGALALMVLSVSAVLAAQIDLTIDDTSGYAAGTTGAGAIVEYIGSDNEFYEQIASSDGTGVFEPFLRVQANDDERGYNTCSQAQCGGDVSEFDTKTGSWTHAILLSDIPVVQCESLDGSQTAGDLCWELLLDLNENNTDDGKPISLDYVEVYKTTSATITGYLGHTLGFSSAAETLMFADDDDLLFNDVNEGTGRRDVRYLAPIEAGDIPAGCEYGSTTCTTFFVLYSELGQTDEPNNDSDGGFEEWKVKVYPFVGVSKTAATTFTRTFDWEIDKSVTPETWDLFEGDTGTSDYTVTLTKGSGVDSAWAVSGSITINNPSEQDAVITGVTDTISGVGSVTVSCGVTFPYTLPAGDDLSCTYSSSLPDGTSRTNTATATLVDGPGFSGTAPITFAAPTTTVNGTVHVTDTYAGGPQNQAFSASGSATYSRTFACDADEGTHDNTATIVETDQSDDASVEVSCHDLDVTKDAAAGFTRTYQWDILKTSTDPAELTLNPGETFTYHYDVTVSVTGFADSALGVSGGISVSNPAPIDAVITGVTDVISPAIAADVDCGVTFPYTLVAGDTLECTYSADVPDDADRTNTATATLQNYDYDSAGVGTESSTTDYSGTADVDFDGAAMTEIDECIDVTDTLQGDLGEVCVADAPKTISYTRTITATEEDCEGITIINTASFVTNDTAATDSDDHTVVVTVPCAQGCTLTQGYWKTHSDLGPAPKADLTWELLPNGPDTEFFLSGQTWYEVFWTNPKKGNAYYILAHQYEAAVLNILSGASSTTEVDAAIAWAETFFSTYTPDNWPKALKTQIVQNAGVLGSYNEGDIGPGHCDEDTIALAGNLVKSSATSVR